ncbi:hypothetical protein CBP31_03740 [Oceanisphaera profunda]|uniref:DUF1439 domain-containing protein n=1 Tax=Oceanisphaera profunda TaxID=1416627 RepID=A0A1Y0D3D9_9GAMM|nr:DUF1439 domain-containing protein [Oceanisphaera profunda]ART81844.1 hypothetical protein CBP31_03740 [Oceanisphaera profunda]
MKIIMFLLILATSGGAWAQALTLSEQQLNQGLNQQLGKDFPLGLGSWLSAKVKMQDVKVELGRQAPDKARVLGQALITLNQGQNRYHWDIAGDFNARPRYDNEQGALFLDEFELLNYQLNEGSSSPQARFMLPMLLQALTGYLSQYPVYTLDDNDPLQRQLKSQPLSLEITPGQVSLFSVN